MDVGDVYYRKIDNCECKIKGFFFRHNNGEQSLIYENLSYLKQLFYDIDKYQQYYVLFYNDTFDTVENLFTNLYMTKVEYDKLQEHILKFEHADGLWSAFDLAIHFPQPTTSYKVTHEELEQESYEGQHTREAYWNDDDFVPNPGEKPKTFKLW